MSDHLLPTRALFSASEKAKERSYAANETHGSRTDELQLNGIVRLRMPASPSHQLVRELPLGLSWFIRRLQLRLLDLLVSHSLWELDQLIFLSLRLLV